MQHRKMQSLIGFLALCWVSIAFATMSGSYDIGGGNNNFPNLINAIDTLRVQGLSGPVTLNLYTGTYNGQVNLPGTIPGLSATNPLTIQNATGESPVITSTAGHAFYLTGADYVTIQGLEITNCLQSGIYNYRSGVNSSDYNQYIGNYVHNVGTGGNHTGIYIGYSEYCQALRNEVEGDYYGIMNYYATSSLIANNMVYNTGERGIRTCYGQNNQIYYNSVYTQTFAAMYKNMGTNVTIKNNIFYQGGSGATYALYVSGDPAMYTMFSDYNDLYAPYGFTVFNNGTLQTLAEWQASSGLDLHSISANPFFVSITTPDLHILSPSPVENIGTPITAITDDFDGDSRHLEIPDIGADEYTGGVTPFYCLGLSPEQGLYTAIPGDSIDHLITIENCGNQNDTYDLTITVSGEAWTHRIMDNTSSAVIDSIQLAVGASDSFLVRVLMPGGIIGGLSSFGELITQSRYGARQILSDTASVTTISNATLSGSYDIGGGNNNFPNLILAAEILRTMGMNAPVTFNAYTGTYNGEVYLPANISGLNEANPLVFQNATGESPVVTADSGNGFFLAGTDYVTIQGFEISDCYFCGIFNEIVDTDSATHNNFIGNYIYHTGLAGMYPALRLNYAGQCQVLGNEIGRAFVGICNFHGKDVTIANNFIYDTDVWNARSCYGVNDVICFNSFYAMNQSAFYWTYGINATLENNIFYQAAPDSSYALTVIGDLSFYSLTSDHNDLYAPNAYVGNYEGTDLLTLADFQTATGLDSHSICADPYFVSLTTPDLHIDTTQISPVDCAGIPIVGITTDVDGELRNCTAPDIGADEFTCALPPSAITDLVITLSGDTTGMHHVTLQWSSVPGAHQYHIYKSTTSPTSGFTLMGSTPDTTYTDTNAIIGESKSFYYVTSDNEP